MFNRSIATIVARRTGDASLLQFLVAALHHDRGLASAMEEWHGV
jgi:hypothetical protein